MVDITQLKVAKESLKKSEEHFRALVEKSGIAISIDDEEGNLIYCNSRYADIFGYSMEEVRGQPISAIVHSDDVERVMPYHTGRLHGKDVPSRYEFRGIRKDGSVIYLEVDVSVLREGERLIGTRSYMWDITERKRAQEKIKDLAKFPSENPFPVLRLDKDGVILYANEASDGLLQHWGCAVGSYAPTFWLDLVAEALSSQSRRTIEIKFGEQTYSFEVVPILDAGYVNLYGSKITERKRAEEALKESAAKLQAVFNTVGTGIIIIDRDTQIIIEANQTAMEMTGLPKKRIIGQICHSLVCPAQAGKCPIKDLGQSVDNSERKLIHADGHLKDILKTVYPITIKGKDCYVESFIDITERKRAEEELRESEEKYRTLVETSAEAIFIAQDGMLKFVNRMASEMTGYSMQELLSSPFLEFIHPDDRDMVGERYLRRLAGDVSQPRYAFRLVSRDGSIKWVEIDAVRVDWEGKPATLNFLSDITKRKQGEEELRRAEDNFRRSLDDSPLGIRIVSAKGETLYANRAILDLYGYDDIEELRSTPTIKRYTAASYTEFQSRRKKRMNGEDSPSKYEINIIRKTGEIRCLQVSRKETVWDGQKQFQAIYQDITEQKKIQERLGETLGSLRSALGGIIQVLSVTIEKRDPYTAGHQKRVADLSRAIGQQMGLSAERVEGLRIAATIHDIGKVSIPAEILSKPTRLTEIEYEMIKSHSQVGYDILRDIDFSWPLAEMVLQHHERMNGSGYPRGLKGEDILLEARILAVSDVVEAMASHRPYRPALGIAAALEEIEKNREILYDPDVASACQTLFREKSFEFKP